MNPPKPHVVLNVAPLSSDTWMFHRQHNIKMSREDARTLAIKLVKEMESQGFFHYRNYRNEASRRKVSKYDRTRWGLKRIDRDNDSVEIADISVIAVEQMYDREKEAWALPEWMLYDHDTGHHEFILNTFDLKLMVAHKSMEQRDHAEFKVLDMEWSKVVNNAFKTLDCNMKGLVCLDDVKWSMFPLKKLYS